MDGLTHTSIASLAPDLFVITMNGLSKSHNIAGFRCGWMCLSGDKKGAGDYIEGIELLSSMRLCSNVPSQLVIEEALNTAGQEDEALLPGGRLYEQRNFITKAINDIPGLSAVKPKGSLYIFPKIDVKRFHIQDDEQFARTCSMISIFFWCTAAASTGRRRTISGSSICRGSRSCRRRRRG
jgi:alanine-synthesizing transaminase